MSETEATPRNSPDAGGDADETVQKVYVKDLKIGEALATVFKVKDKQRLSSRSGKPYLSLVMVDRTGQIDGRIFDNVDQADAAFSVGDYLLVRGTVGHFHGKPQLVVERLERLDPEPIDPKEYEWAGPPPEERKEREPREAKGERGEKDDNAGHKAARARIIKLLDDPGFAIALDSLLRRYEKLTGDHPEPGRKTHPAPKVEKKQRGGRGEGAKDARPPKPEEKKEEAPAEAKKPQRDGSLPEGLTFKPLSDLVGENSTPGANEG